MPQKIIIDTHLPITSDTLYEIGKQLDTSNSGRHPYKWELSEDETKELEDQVSDLEDKLDDKEKECDRWEEKYDELKDKYDQVKDDLADLEDKIIEVNK